MPSHRPCPPYTQRVRTPDVDWMPLSLPFHDGNRSEELAAALRALRVPAWVRYRRIDGSGTAALVPIDDKGRVLSVSSGYGPTVEWELADIERVRDELERVGLNGLLLDALPWPEPPAGTNGSPDVAEVGDVSSPDGSDDPVATRIDAAAWEGSEDDGVWAVLSRKFKVSISIVADGASSVIAPDDPTQGVDSGIWAGARGIVMWRAGDELSAVFVRGRQVHQLLWVSPEIAVEPQRPGQVLTGGYPVLISREEIADENNVSPWIKQFSLSADQASLLRALVRAEPSPHIGERLGEILGEGQFVARLISGCVDVGELTPRRIAPATWGRAVRAGVDRELLPWYRRSRAGRFRLRHPGVVLTAALLLMAVLFSFGFTGIVDGRPTAVLPLIGGVVALLEAGLAIYLLDARRRGAVESAEAAATELDDVGP